LVKEKSEAERAKPTGMPAAFLLAQVGAHAAGKFRERLEPLGFQPHDAGILRLLEREPGLSQQDLAAKLRMYASRLVSILDDLEKRGLLERRAAEGDRRLYALHLTAEGKKSLAAIGQAARQHEKELLASLTEEERRELGRVLGKVAEEQGLVRGVHPGYGRPQ
jgi:DNA-binding MarR family transcriptional regulator